MNEFEIKKTVIIGCANKIIDANKEASQILALGGAVAEKCGYLEPLVGAMLSFAVSASVVPDDIMLRLIDKTKDDYSRNTLIKLREAMLCAQELVNVVENAADEGTTQKGNSRWN